MLVKKNIKHGFAHYINFIIQIFLLFFCLVLSIKTLAFSSDSSNTQSVADRVSQKKETIAMTPIDEIINALKSIDSKLFFGPESSLVLRAEEVIQGKKFDGIVIRAPQVVNIDNSRTIPLLVVFSQNGKRERDVPPGDHAFVICKDITEDTTWKVPLFSMPKGKIPMPKEQMPPLPPENPEMRSVRMTATIVFDLHSKANIPLKLGKFSVRIVIKDWESNEVNIELMSEK